MCPLLTLFNVSIVDRCILSIVDSCKISNVESGNVSIVDNVMCPLLPL